MTPGPPVFWSKNFRVTAIRDFHSENKRGVPARIIPKVKKAVDRITQRKEGRQPSIAEISEETGISQRRVAWVLANSRSVLSSDYVSENFDDSSESGVMASYAATSQESESRYLELLERVSESVRTARLNPQERSVINHRYGFDGQEVTRGVRIGERMGVTESRVSQIHASALAKIRKTVSDSA